MPAMTWAERRAEPLLYLVTAVTTSIATFFALTLWRADLRVPFEYSGDAIPTGAHFKTVIEEGWYEYQPRLGAPAGQLYNDFPTADNLHLIAAKVLGLFTSDWAVALNSYFLLGFVFAALGAVWFLRTCLVSRPLTAALATLFAIAPYHFARGESHLWLASYFAIPLGLGLLVLMFRRERLWARGSAANPVLAWVFSPATRTTVWIALLATSSSYYAVFFLILLAFTGVVLLIRDRNWRTFGAAVAAGVATVVVMLVNMLPDLAFGWQNGANAGGLARSRSEAEIYALKLSQLLLPWPEHRVDFLRQIRERYDAIYPLVSERPALGIIAACGLIAAFIFLAVNGLLKRAGTITAPRWSIVAALSSLTFVAFLFASVGGLATFISFFTASLRGWNRMSIVIAMLSLAVVGLLLDLLIGYLAARRSWKAAAHTAAAIVVSVALLVVGYIDQTPERPAERYAQTKVQFAADRDWFESVESSLEPSSMVLLLPYIPYPESANSAGFLAAEQLVGYLQTNEIRWSNGGIKGRPTADWPGQLSSYPTHQLVDLAATAGFSGIVIQRDALLDHGAELETVISQSLGTAPLVSRNGQYSFFDIADRATEITAAASDAAHEAASASITNPVTPYAVPSFFRENFESGSATPFRGPVGGSFKLANATDAAVPATLSFTLTSDPHVTTALVTLPDGTKRSVTLVDGSGTFSTRLNVDPGTWDVGVAFVGAERLPGSVSALSDMKVIQEPLADFLATLPPQ
jgi:hypothetical protein